MDKVHFPGASDLAFSYKTVRSERRFDLSIPLQAVRHPDVADVYLAQVFVPWADLWGNGVIMVLP